MADEGDRKSTSPVQSQPRGALAQVMAGNKAASTTNVRHRSPSGSAPKALLSCELCRTRKIKCDKADGGCSNCKRAGVKCIALNRQRLPRGRNGGRKKADAELKARVGRLENLVRTLESGGGDSGAVDDAVKWLLSDDKDEMERQKKATRLAHTTPKDMHRYLSSPFWSSLSDEVNGLRDVLNDDSDGDDDDDTSTDPSLHQQSASEAPFSFVLCGPDSLIVGSEAMQHPPRFMAQALCVEYGRNLTTVFNILHYPSVSAFLIDDKPYLHYPRGHQATECLSFAVYLAAITSKAEEECLRDFGESKRALVKKYRFRLEAALSRADFINTTDITVLQSLMLLLICARAQDNCRFTWTMLSLAVRIAQAMGLHEDDLVRNFTPFEHEMRRRVWNALCMLDFQAVKDRGSLPLIAINGFTTPPPLNVNDHEISPSTKEYPESRDGMTSMSLNIISGYAARVGKQLNFVPRGENGRPPTEIEQNWDTRQEIVLSFRREFEEHFGKYADPNNPRDVGVRVVAETIARCLLLAAVRPLERHPKSNPPRISGTNLLNLTSTMLESTQIARQKVEWRSFSWFGAFYNQWHPLAVMAAELCTNTEGPAVDRAWAVVEPSMAFFKTTVADDENGMLWRPISKLMKKAREMRAKKLESLGLSAPTMTFDAANFTPSMTMPSSLHEPSMANLNVAQMLPAGSNTDPNICPHPPNGPSMDPASVYAPVYGQIWNSWSAAPEAGMDLGAPSSSGDSPGMAWSNWENFVQDLDQNNDPLFDMNAYEMNGLSMDPFDSAAQLQGASPMQS